ACLNLRDAQTSALIRNTRQLKRHTQEMPFSVSLLKRVSAGKEGVMKRFSCLLLFCVLTASTAFTQTKFPVEGVWKIAEVDWLGVKPADEAAPITNPQPGLMIFTKGYYSTVAVLSDQPRVAAAPAKDPQNLTDGEKIARHHNWRRFAASSGVYEIKGTTLIRRVMVAKNVQVMTRGTPTFWEFKLEGPNTLWLIPTGDLVKTEPRVKLTRLE